MKAAADFFDTRTRNWRARLAISLDMMRELSRYSDPAQLYQAFARRMGQLFPTSRQILLSRRGVEPPLVRVTRFNLWAEPADPFSSTARFPEHRSDLFAQLLYADEPHVIDELTVDPSDPAADYLQDQQSLLAIPIFENGEVRTAIVLTREEPAAFPPEQVPELVWMTNLFGRAAQTLVLTQALQSAYADAEAEIHAIAELQESLLPKEPPAVSGLDIAAHSRNAHRAGGDYYDFFPQPDGSLGVLIADVSGHGAPAAVLMAITHSIAHAAGAPTASPAAFLTHLNTNLTGRYNRASSSFVTAFYAIAKPLENQVVYASAGHPPPWFTSRSGELALLNRAQKLPLGINPAHAKYVEHARPFTAGDSITLVTDGVTEAVDRHGEVFGSERVQKVLKKKAHSAEDVLHRLLIALNRFTAKAAQADDRTVVVLRRS